MQKGLLVTSPFLNSPTSFLVNTKNGGDSHRDRSVGVLTHHHYCVLVSLEFAAALPPIQPIHRGPSGTSQWLVSCSIQKPQRGKYLTGRLYKAPTQAVVLLVKYFGGLWTCCSGWFPVCSVPQQLWASVHELQMRLFCSLQCEIKMGKSIQDLISVWGQISNTMFHVFAPKCSKSSPAACTQTLSLCVLVHGQRVWLGVLDENIPALGWLLEQAQQLADSRHATANSVDYGTTKHSRQSPLSDSRLRSPARCVT